MIDSLFNRNQPWSAAVPFAAGDASKTIKATPGAGKALVITRYHVYITTSAAQAIDLEDTSGTVEVAKFPASLAVGSYLGPSLQKGIQLTANEAFIYKPAAAGPAGHVVAEGYIVSTTATT
jgi:hypothetical protein